MNAIVSNKSFDFSDTNAVARRLTDWQERVETQCHKQKKTKHFVRDIGTITIFKTFERGALVQVEVCVSTFGSDARLNFKLDTDGVQPSSKFDLVLDRDAAGDAVARTVMLLGQYGVDAEITTLAESIQAGSLNEMHEAFPVTQLLGDDATRIYGNTLNAGIAHSLCSIEARENCAKRKAAEDRLKRTYQSLPAGTLLVAKGLTETKLVMISDRKGTRTKRSIVDFSVDGRKTTFDLWPSALLDYGFKLLSRNTSGILPEYVSEHFTGHELIEAIASGDALIASNEKHAEIA